MAPPTSLTDDELLRYADLQDDVYIQELAYRLRELHDWARSHLGAHSPKFNHRLREYERGTKKEY